jgi:hypothetical protein
MIPYPIYFRMVLEHGEGKLKVFLENYVDCEGRATWMLFR